MEKYRVTKLGNVAHPYHRNSIFGESKPFHVGYFVREPIEGERFNLIGFDSENKGISTSNVVKIIDDNTFETLNSIYRYERYE